MRMLSMLPQYVANPGEQHAVLNSIGPSSTAMKALNNILERRRLDFLGTYAQSVAMLDLSRPFL